MRRDEAAKFFVKVAEGLWKTDYVKSASECSFSDLDDGHADLKDVMVKSCRLWIFQGHEGKFMPTWALTNSQALAVMIRITSGYESETGVSYWADNYYKKAQSLWRLSLLPVLNNKEWLGTRGTVAQLVYNYNIWNQKSCKLNPLKNIDAIKIDDVVKNCTYKNKTWVLPEGLGGANFPLVVLNDKLVVVDPFKSNVQWWTLPESICSFIDNDSTTQFAWEITSNYSNNNLYSMHTKNVLNKGLVNVIETFGYSDDIYCSKNDTDCWFMNNRESRTDGNNYFVKWYRVSELSSLDKYPRTGYYAINDKLYESQNWNFWGIQNEKIIVKRLNNLVKNENTMTTTFVLQTCEINI